MSETINKGWIKSPDEIKFAPKTFAEQVIVNGETTLDMELEKYETIKNNCPTLDAEDTEGTCTAGDYVSRIQELEAKNLELTNELAELNSKIVYEERVYTISFNAGISAQLIDSNFFREGYLPISVMPIQQDRGLNTMFGYTVKSYNKELWVHTNSVYDETDATLILAIAWMKMS